MTQQQLETRLTDLERQVDQLTEQIQPLVSPDGWKRTFGAFADDPGFDEVLELGRECREQANLDQA